MNAVSLKVFSRTQTRRGGCKRLRAEGRVPAVMYGRSSESQNLEVDARALADLLHRSASETILVDLAVQGDSEASHLALVQEVHHHPLSGALLHIDFHQVAADEEVTVRLPVESEGEAAGVKTGGVLEHVLLKVRVSGLPRDLPEVITVDVTSLGVGETIHLGEIPLPKGVKLVGDPGIPVMAVAAPLTEAQAAEAVEADTTPLAEPAMIKEKKEGEGDAEGESK